AKPGATAPATPRPVVLGMSIGPLDEATKTRLGVNGGVLVENVRADSDAAEQGLRRGVVITSVNDRPVNSAADVSALVDSARKAGRTGVLLNVRLAGQQASIVVKLN
ncbi:PDZ domain-containing protein, partial [Caulobacter sp. SLTY]|uniref:PDZ domain-containing protein n=1 Tax=Caulobacter sp. SLTY TaxID=2683262 RepID=UPI0014134C37